VKRGDAEPPAPAANPMLLGLAPEDHFLRELVKIRAGDLEQALLVLPLAQVTCMSY